MTKTDLEFRILVIVICLIFVICDLEFLFQQYFSTPEQLAIFTGKDIVLTISCSSLQSLQPRIPPA